MTHKGKKKSAPPCSSKSNTATAKNNNHARNQSREKRSRRQANKWQESSDDSDTNFRASLLNQGYTIKEMNGDGNCLFRSLADQLSYLQHSCVIGASNNNSMHVVVRQDVCNYLSQHKEEFQHFLLMEDDDEDVFNVDQYIEKMRKDGEWGGNVEIVVASRLYKRNIKVFSSEYFNGVLSIEHDEDERAYSRDEISGDLMLAYHGNDHYNSVIRLNSKQPSSLHPSSKVRKKNNNVKSADDTNKSNDGILDSQDHDNATNPNEGTEISSSSKSDAHPPTRGSNCPCGSGKKYKKCCMAQEKAKKRRAKFAAENHHDTEEGSNSHPEKKEDADDDEYIGNFRVISI